MTTTARPTPPNRPDSTYRPHERVRHALDFRRAFDRRKSVSDNALVVYAVENGLDFPRLGISVGKKKVKKANARNRVKRLLREAFRLTKSEIPPGIDLVVVPRGPNLDFDTAIRSLPKLARDAARRLGIRMPRSPAATPPEEPPRP